MLWFMSIAAALGLCSGMSTQAALRAAAALICLALALAAMLQDSSPELFGSLFFLMRGLLVFNVTFAIAALLHAMGINPSRPAFWQALIHPSRHTPI
ncbi:hypothetical protein [Oryzibacter oryziterrae]|uniref:hypothetical protein n=1 Tax=Oryzibacter oryziterrae TaxID=2766474 RepID=UPI001F24B766|nr:hypothetical protein [Oryzibacter oryziterrae]